MATKLIGLVLGASAFPKKTELSAPRGFKGSGSEIAAYLTAADGLRVPQEDVLNLFDSEGSPSDQISELSKFIRSHKDATDVLIYYVGHGFLESSDYYLAIRRTEHENEGASSLRMKDLAKVIKKNVGIRNFIILDCCFAASAIAQFQSSAAEDAMTQKTLEEFPRSGTAVLCSSSAYDVSLAPSNSEYTLFSGALLQVLRHGNGQLPAYMSFEEVEKQVRSIIRDSPIENPAQPELHVPVQVDGNIATLPFFPNPARRQLEMEERLTRLEGRLADLGEEIRRTRSTTTADAQPTAATPATADEIESHGAADQFRRAKRGGTVWCAFTLVACGLTILAMAQADATKSYIFWAVMYVALFIAAGASVLALLQASNRHALFKRLPPNPVLDTTTIVAMKNTNTYVLFGSIWVTSPYFEIASLIYLVTLVAIHLQDRVASPIVQLFTRP